MGGWRASIHERKRLSKALDRISKNVEEIDDLLQAHAEATGGGKPGRPERRAQVLNKSGIVLICAFWQSYCEDVLFEILGALSRGRLSAVPEALRVAIGNRILSQTAPGEPRKNPDPKQMWRLAGIGWKEEILDLITRLSDDRSRPLDSPNSTEVTNLFSRYLGVRDISKQWHWQGMSAARACAKLDHFVKIRHKIAHRGSNEVTIKKLDVIEFGYHINHLANRTDNALKDAGFVG